jgi:hypothetical protein
MGCLEALSPNGATITQVPSICCVVVVVVVVFGLGFKLGLGFENDLQPQQYLCGTGTGTFTRYHVSSL